MLLEIAVTEPFGSMLANKKRFRNSFSLPRFHTMYIPKATNRKPDAGIE